MYKYTKFQNSFNMRFRIDVLFLFLRVFISKIEGILKFIKLIFIVFQLNLFLKKCKLELIELIHFHQVLLIKFRNENSFNSISK